MQTKFGDKWKPVFKTVDSVGGGASNDEVVVEHVAKRADMDDKLPF
jgi:hypothetical protein